MKKAMLYPIKPGCFKPRKDGTSIIHIQYCYSSDQKTLLDTKIQIPVSCWDKKGLFISDNLPAEFGNARQLNNSLAGQLRLVEDIIVYAEKNNVADKGAFLKTFYSPDLDIYSLGNLVKAHANKKNRAVTEQEWTNLDVFFQIEAYMNSKVNKVSDGMLRIYRNMRDHLNDYQDARKIHITFESFTLEFYEDFVDFLSYEYVQHRKRGHVVGLKVNTVGKTIRQMRNFLNNRMKRKIIGPIDLSGWKVFEEEVDAEYCNWDEIDKIYSLDLSARPNLIPYRDEFVLGCLTALRFSDFSAIDKPDVRGDFLYKKQQKSSHWVVIPLRKAAREILANRFSQPYEALTIVEFNRHIKTICKLAGLTMPIKHTHKKGNKKIIVTRPKYEWIASHSCRRSFCTNEFLAGTPVELIMKISGHKSAKDFYRYIRVSPEEAAIKIKEMWEKRMNGDVANCQLM